jgi:hypothetical protein
MSRRWVVFVGSIAVWIAAFACTNNNGLPPQQGPCVPSATVKCGGGLTGSGSSGGEAGPATACATDAGSACDECAAADCCSEFTTCEQNTNCASLLNCEVNCTTSSCFTTCQNQFPLGTGDLQIYSSCLSARCPVCNESGVGDPCSTGFAGCETGLTCSNGLWCTKTCAQVSDCAGLGAGGVNSLGYANTCVGGLCVPECTSNETGCQDFPGSFCATATTIANTSQLVCFASTTADASGQ